MNTIMYDLPNTSAMGKMWHKVNFLNRVQLVLIQSFPSWLVA